MVIQNLSFHQLSSTLSECLILNSALVIFNPCQRRLDKKKWYKTFTQQ
jgi:hypothetical protein